MSVDLVLRPLVYAALSGLLLAPLERLSPERRAGRTRRSLRTDLGFATVGVVMAHALVAFSTGGILSALASPDAPLALLGLPLAEHAAVVVAMQTHTLFVHANLRTPGWLAWLVATPAFHHRHHDREATLANYASLFPWIDRVFGTASEAPAGAFGLPGPEREGFVALLVAPLRRGCGRPAGRRRPARGDRPA